MVYKKKAFTLIEIIVAISIIAVILTISIFSYSEIRSNGRNFKRVSDINQLQLSLEMYYRDVGFYPEELIAGEALVNPNDSSIIYINKIPSNPSPRNDGPCSAYDYTYESGASSTYYTIDFCIGKSVNELIGGLNCATPEGIRAGFCNFVCGRDSIDYEGELYPTTLIGEQCWMAKNLNIGTRIDTCQSGPCTAGVDCDQTCSNRSTSINNPSNNSIIEKYCYNDIEANCNLYGGLYSWNEAMQYVTNEEARGICPEGWHIPSDDEWTTLERFACDSSTCDTDFPYGTTPPSGGEWRGTNEGQKIKSTSGWGPSGNGTDNFGFNIKKGNSIDSSGDYNEANFIWSSTRFLLYTSYYSLYRRVDGVKNNIYRYYGSASHTKYSIRCLKD